MKETRITVPEGYEVEKIEPIEGAIIVTYKEKEWKTKIIQKQIFNAIGEIVAIR